MQAIEEALGENRMVEEDEPAPPNNMSDQQAEGGLQG